MEPLPTKLAPPIQNEKKPASPIKWVLPFGAFRYKVRDGDTWEKVARENYVSSAQYLIFFNFYTYVGPFFRDGTDQVNWYLRNYVGCNVSRDNGRNWAFSNSADPGIIFVPIRKIEGDALVVTGSKGVGNVVTVPEYDDSGLDLVQLLEKAVDIVGAGDLAIGISGIEIPLLVEVGLIAVGMVGTLVAMGAAHAEALQIESRKHFFGAFATALVMSANGASDAYIKDRNWLHYPPANAVYPEKRESFRQLHNAGIILGMRMGRRFNRVDQARFFSLLHQHLNPLEQQEYSPHVPWKEWSELKRRNYYLRLSSIVKQSMLENDLKLKIR